MLLTKVLFRDFRSVSRVLELHVRSNLTCLIGANEHGKSNLLEGINKVNSGVFEEFDKNVYAAKDSAPSVALTFELSGKERASLLGVLEEERAPHADTEEPQRVKTRLLYDGAIATLKKANSPTLQVDVVGEGKIRFDLGNVSFGSSPNEPTAKRRKLHQWFDETGPQVRLFEPPSELVDHITLPQLESEHNLPFEGLLKLAGVWEDRAELFTGEIGAQRLLTKANTKLTRTIRRIWSQGAHHTFRFSESGGRLLVGIQDPNTYDVPSRRSLGFKSFLSFYLTLYSQTEETDPEGFVLLFDEPGIHLHPQGQKDLLRELRRLSTRNQIVYTTHSPFMIDRNDLSATLLVRKGVAKGDRGTRIVYKPYGANWSSLNAALGITPSDSFFAPDDALLVEGTSDRLYMVKYMALCRAQTKADLNYLFMMDADRREEMEALVRMLVTANRRIVVLVDGDKGGEDWSKRLKHVAGAKKARLEFLDLRKLLKAEKDVSIEDALPVELWFDAVDRYLLEILKADAKLDRRDVLRRARTVSLGRAASESLHEAGILSKPTKFSKTSVADLFCQGLEQPPAADAPMARLCLAVTKALRLQS
jgi:hypothetical protein